MALPSGITRAASRVNRKAPAGAFLFTREAARVMPDGSAIINIASQAAKTGFRQMAPYVSSKHGMIGLTRTAAIDLAPKGIRVNAVCPNHVTTAMAVVT